MTTWNFSTGGSVGWGNVFGGDDYNPYNNNTGNGGGRDRETRTVDEDELPLANLPPTADMTTVMDSEIPLASLPKTGGTRKASSLISTLLAALAGFAIRSKSEKQESEDAE